MTVGELMEALAAAPRDAEALVTFPYDDGWASTCGAAVPLPLTLVRKSLLTGPD